VKRFFQTILDTTGEIENLEIILGIDDDDLSSQDISHDKLLVKKVILPRGSTMGALNRACFEASSGRYVMLVNDDINLRTKNWDKIIAFILSDYPDDIALVHVNDMLYQERLCTFPMLSRKACLEIGICPAEYQRYRIDDHIYDIYNILAYLGHKRIFYLPDVIFQHLNYETDVSLQAGKTGPHTTQLDNGRIYNPDKEIIERDADIFDNLLEQRKKDAMKLASLIEGERFLGHELSAPSVRTCSGRIHPTYLCDKSHRYNSPKRKFLCNQVRYMKLLNSIKNSYSYRKSNFVKKVPLKSTPSRIREKATVVVVTSDIRKKYAKRCISLIKKYTENFELMIFDNNNSKNFNHPTEMNKALRIVNTDFLVLMDDDVYVEKNWLEKLVDCVDDETALVTPLYKNKNGAISYSGVYLMGDGYGTHAHLIDIPDKARECQCLCSACLLVNMKKCRDILFNIAYKKYFLDLDYSLQVWERGFKVICTPEVIVTHLAGATMLYGSLRANSLVDEDRETFIKEWIESGRLVKLEGIWSKYPFLKTLVSIPRKINQTLGNAEKLGFNEFKNQVEELLKITEGFNLFKSLMFTKLNSCIRLFQSKGDNLKVRFCKKVIRRFRGVKVAYSGFLQIPLGHYQGYKVVRYGKYIYAFPQGLELFIDLTKEELRKPPVVMVGKTLEELKNRIPPQPKNLKLILDCFLNHPKAYLKLSIIYLGTCLKEIYKRRGIFLEIFYLPRKIRDLYCLLHSCVCYYIYALTNCYCLMQNLSAEGINEIACFGVSGITRGIIVCAKEFGMKITEIYDYDDIKGLNFHGFRVKPIRLLSQYPDRILITSLINLRERSERLLSLAVPKEKIISIYGKL